MQFLLAALLSTSQPVFASVIDRVVVVVDDSLVMASDVAFEEALAPRDRARLPFWDPEHKTATERLIDAAVIRQRAGEVNLYTPHPDEVRARVEMIRLSFRDRESWQAFLSQWGFDEGTLGTVVRRRMVVERYLARNVQGSPRGPEWLNETDRLLDDLRASHRIRRVPAHR